MEATHLERFWDHFRAGPLPARELETVLPRALAVGALLARPAAERCRALASRPPAPLLLCR